MTDGLRSVTKKNAEVMNAKENVEKGYMVIPCGEAYITFFSSESLFAKARVLQSALGG